VVKEAVERGEVKLEKVDTINNVADILTKPLAKPRFEELRKRAGVQLIGPAAAAAVAVRGKVNKSRA
jgi:hypothetical protein